MSSKALFTETNLEGVNVADLYDVFRNRVGEKRDIARRAAQAFEASESDVFYELVNPQLGDGAFDQALQDSFSAGEIEPSLFQSMMFTLLEAASSAGVADGHGAVTVTELFALPLTGTIEEVLETSSRLDVAHAMARSFSSTLYVADGTRVMLSPTTIDPLAAAALRPAIARQIAYEFQDAFANDYDEAAAERLFEAVQGPFEFLGVSGRNHLEDRGTVTRLMIGATQRTLSTTHATSADAFLFNMLDEVTPDEMLESSERFIGALCRLPGVTAVPYYPLPIARSTAFAALTALGGGLQAEAKMLGICCTDGIFDEMSITRFGGEVFAEARVGDSLLGPCAIPGELVRRDDAWFVSHLALYAEEFNERTEMISSSLRRN